MVQQGVDLVHEEWIQLLGDLLLISEGEGAFEGDPSWGVSRSLVSALCTPRVK